MHRSEAQSELATHLFTLFIRCPFGQAAENCPFADIRAMPSLELKFRLAEKIALHPQCSENMRHTHGACYRERVRTVMQKWATVIERKMKRHGPLSMAAAKKTACQGKERDRVTHLAH